jgi:hypothetical protein
LDVNCKLIYEVCRDQIGVMANKQWRDDSLVLALSADLAAARAEVEKLTATVRQVEQEMRDRSETKWEGRVTVQPDPIPNHRVLSWADTLREALKEQ